MPYKRSIRLKEYDYSADGAYFVTICTFGRARIVTEARKILLKRELIALEHRFQGVHIDFYVFMDNHIHVIFLFHGATVTLSRVLQVYKSRTTIALRKSGYRPSKFWQPNYYEHVVRDEEALNAIRGYICLNPEQEVVDFKAAMKKSRRASSPPTS